MTDTRYTKSLERLLAAVMLELDASREGRAGGEWPGLLGAWEAVQEAKPWRRRALADLERQLDDEQ